MKRIFCFVLAALMLVSLAACSSEVSNNPNVGTWTGVLVDAFGMEGDIKEVYARGASLELNANGKCTAIFNRDKATGKWTGSSSRLTVSIGGDDYRCTIDGDALIFELMEGMNVIYTRNGSLPISHVSNVPTTAIDDAATPRGSMDEVAPRGSEDDAAPKPEAVTWIAFSVDMFDVVSDIEALYAKGASLEIVDDGTCTLVFNGEQSKGTWAGSSSDMTINIGGQQHNSSIEDGILAFELMDGVLIFFEKDGNTPSGSSTDASAHGDADYPSAGSFADAIAWWDGYWYGTFYIYDTNEPYADMRETFEDVYAVIETEDNGTATVYLWTEYYELGTVFITINAEGRSFMGTVVANGGELFSEAVHFGDWNIEPFICRYDNMIEIREIFTDDDGDWFDYEFLLRPWGADWEDVPDYEQPFYYEWYMSVCNRPMLEVVREVGDMTHSLIR